VIISKEFAGRAKDAVSLPELRRLRDAQPPRHAQRLSRKSSQRDQ